MSIAKGNAAYVLRKVEYGDDPITGSFRTEFYEGTKNAIETILHPLATAAGARVSISTGEGGKQTLQATWSQASGSNGGTVDPSTDRWELTTEWAQLDIRNHPKIHNAAGTVDKLNEWWHDMDAALRNGVTLASIEAKNGHVASVQKTQIFELRARGTDSFEIKRPVLRRVRTISPRSSSRVVVSAIERIYTTSRLISAFSIPVAVQNQLPANPPDSIPTLTAWGWKERTQSSTYIVARNMIEEQNDWVFSLWSTILLDVLS